MQKLKEVPLVTRHWPDLILLIGLTQLHESVDGELAERQVKQQVPFLLVPKHELVGSSLLGALLP
jgi:hypothetical protein